MQAESVLLEPWYDFSLTVPMQHIGRAITDIRAMAGRFDAPEAKGAQSELRGTSALFTSLCGDWDFKFYNSPEDVPELNDPALLDGCEKMTVPITKPR